MTLAQLSDLHLRDQRDLGALARQLERIAARRPDHLVVTGDLLDRWDPVLLDGALDLFERHGFLDRERLTVIHGNHDLASSGGHPRQRSDLWRLVFRFWDPPPLLAARKRRFYERIGRRSEGVAAPAPWLKTLANGLRLAMVDSIPATWAPFGLHRDHLTLRHACGRISRSQCDWLGLQRGPLVVLVHHYPLPVHPFRWHVAPGLGFRPTTRSRAWVHNWYVEVPMAIDAAGRTALWEAARKANAVAVLCGHVHRARLEWLDGIAVGLNGQSGAEWAGRTVAYYRLDGRSVTVEHENAARAA